MKKILFVFALIIVSFAARSQTITADLDTAIGAYIYERDEGDIPAAENLAYELIIKAASCMNIMFSAGTGDTESAASALSDLNARLGTSYSLPTFNFDETAQSYITVDSLKVGDGDYVDSLITWAGVQSVASSAGMVTGDSTWVQDQISDSVQASITLLRGDISDSLTAAITGDSTWVKITVDTINFSTHSANFAKNGSSGINVTTAGVLGHVFSGYNFYSNQSNGFTLPNTSTNDIRFVPNRSDDNSGFTWISADKLSAQAGDLNVAYFFEVGNKEILEAVDSFVVGGYSNFLDSVYLNDLIDAEGDEQWLGLSKTGAIFADSISDAGYGLTDKLTSIFGYMLDTEGGELAYRHYNSDGKIVTEYGLSSRPTEAVESLQWGLEHAFRYIRQLYVIVIILSVLVVALVMIVIFKK